MSWPIDRQYKQAERTNNYEQRLIAIFFTSGHEQNIFYFVETFVFSESQVFAVVNKFKSVEKMDRLHEGNGAVNTQMFILEEFGDLQLLLVEHLMGKCVLLKAKCGKCLASLVSEGFEHN